jgi:hypothetical protein
MTTDLLWRLRIALAIAGIAALVYGVFNVFTSLTNMSPTKLKYSEYCDQRPSAKWLELDDAWVDFRDAFVIETVKDMKKKSTASNVIKTEYYAPIWKAHDGEETCVAFLKCNDSSSIELARQGSNVSITNPDQLNKWYLDNDKRMFLNRTVKGLVVFGLNSDDESRKLLNKAAGGKLDSNFVIIDENVEPKGGLGFLLVVVGIALLAGTGATFLIKPQAAAQPLPARPGQTGQHRPMGARRAGARGSTRAPIVAPPPPVVQAPPIAALPQNRRGTAVRPASTRTAPLQRPTSVRMAPPPAPPPQRPPAPMRPTQSPPPGPRMPRKRPRA